MGLQGMMGAGFDPTFMGRGAGYGGFLVPSFPQVNPMAVTGVSPHVNPTFFGRGMTNNGMGIGMRMGMMGPTGMDGQQGMWSDTNMGGGGGEEYEDGGSEYGYGDASQEKGVRSNVASREEWGSERDWLGNSEKGTGMKEMWKRRDLREPSGTRRRMMTGIEGSLLQDLGAGLKLCQKRIISDQGMWIMRKGDESEDPSLFSWSVPFQLKKE